MRHLVASCFALALIAPRVPAAPPRPVAPAADYGQMAVDLLREYVRIDTTVPPGNELKSALFYKGLLEREGLTAEVDEFAPGRANLMVRLAGNGSKRALILMNHMDVVPADPARWSVPPFSGLLKDGIIYGRGAQDMKSEGILQLLALVRLHREKVVLDRDVIFLATADEEADFLGALRAISAEGWHDRLAGAEFLITEGNRPQMVKSPEGRTVQEQEAFERPEHNRNPKSRMEDEDLRRVAGGHARTLR